MDGWVQASALSGPWSQAQHEPAKDLDRFREAAAANNQNQVLGNPDQSLTQAYGVRRGAHGLRQPSPAELLLSRGDPDYVRISGTNLLYVRNSGNDIFMDTATQTFYVLAAGRWFTSSTLQNGAWSFVPGSGLPGDFSRIPAYSPKASVLVSVPGTLQAKEALIANQIPQTATITRSAAKLNVTYAGAPRSIPGAIVGQAVRHPFLQTVVPDCRDRCAKQALISLRVFFEHDIDWEGASNPGEQAPPSSADDGFQHPPPVASSRRPAIDPPGACRYVSSPDRLEEWDVEMLPVTEFCDANRYPRIPDNHGMLFQRSAQCSFRLGTSEVLRLKPAGSYRNFPQS